MKERGPEQLDSLSAEQQENQEKLEVFLEEIRPTIMDFIFDKLNESDYSYEKRQMIEEFTQKNPAVSVAEITKRIEKIEKDIEQLKNEQLAA